MTVYRDAAHAISRVMSIETIDGTKKSSWQSRYSSGFIDGSSQSNPCPLSDSERLTQDSVTRGALHRELPELAWRVLVAKYSINDQEAVGAIKWMVTRIPGPAHAKFRDMAATTWAIPRRLPSPWYDMNNWDDDGIAESTRRRWRKQINGWLNDRLDEAFKRCVPILEERGLIECAAA